MTDPLVPFVAPGAAVFQRGNARRPGRPRAPPAHARFRSGAGARRGRDRRSCRRATSASSPRPAEPNSTISPRWPKRSSAAGNLAIPLVNALTAEVGQTQPEGRRLRALGRHQPGRHRHRHGARTARRDRRADPRSRPRHQGASSRWPAATAATSRWRARCCSRRCRCRSGSSSRATPRRWRARATGCGGCARKRWCCSSAAPPARSRRSATRASTCPSGSPRCSTSPCPTRPGTPTATASPRSPRRSRILAGTCGKIARDVALLMQSEVGEAFEPAAPGRGGSSTLPHKRNPIGAAAALVGRDDRAQPRRDHPQRADPGARALGRRLAGGMGDLPGPRAGRVRHAARRRRDRRRPRPSTSSA